MTTLAASSGPDLQQIIFVVVFIVIGLVQWLYKLWQEKRDHAERERQPPPSAEEQEARRRAWEEQNRRVEAPAPSRPQPPYSQPSAPPLPAPTTSRPAPAPGGLGDLIDTFRKAMEEAQQPKPAAPPPPLPAPAPRAPSVPHQQPAKYTPPHPVAATSVSYSQPQRNTSASTAVHAPVLSAKSAVSGLSFDQRAPRSQRRAHSLTAYLRSTGGYRKAFILKEVLDAPKALQKSPWPVD